MERLKKLKCSTKFCRNTKAPGRTLCYKCRTRKARKNNLLYYTFKAFRDNAKRRGKQFDITLVQFIQFCKDTGYMEHKGKTGTSYSIDRIRQNEGYNINNIQILTLAQNTSKHMRQNCPF